MAQLKVKDHIILFDEEDRELIEARTWYVREDHKTHYASAPMKKANGDRVTAHLHRVILAEELKGTKLQVDHINHNGLDNRRVNLRLVTVAQNQHNKRAYKNSSVHYKGVSETNDNGRAGYRAHIEIRVGRQKKRKRFSKRFACHHLAAIWYNEMAGELFGEYAYLNDVPDEYYT